MNPFVRHRSVSVATLCLGLSLLPAQLFAQAERSEHEADIQELDDYEVVGDASQVELSDRYAGDQVARGARAGLLGNLDYMNSPFSSTAFTAQLVRDQQSTSIGDVLQNDPFVQVAKGFGNFQELYVVRGFPVFSDDMTFNGVYGILPRQFLAAEFVQRVEVFRGANAFINGAAPGGSGVGGSFNIVPKRSTPEPLTRLTGGVSSKALGYAAADLSRTFGAANDYGVRLNAVVRDGETAVEDQDRALSMFSSGFDYLGERLRLSADLGYQDHRVDAPRPQVTPNGAPPEPPDSDSSYAQPWTYTDERQLFAAVRGEYDLSDTMTFWLAAGGRDGEEANVLANPNANPDGSTSAYRFDNTREDSVLSADTGLRAEFATGVVRHRMTVSAATFHSESDNAYAFSDFSGFAGDLYSPMDVPPPTADFFVGGDLNNPMKTEEVRNSSVALADMLEMLDGRVLVTVGARWQSIETASFDYDTGAEIARYDDNAVTPAFGVVYRPAPRWSLYGNYTESLQPGETAPATSGGQPVQNAGEILDPYRGQQIELGAKFDGTRYGATAAVFTLAQPSAIVTNGVFQADGERRHTGLELAVFGEPLAGLRLLGGATYIDAQLERTQDGANEGNEPIGVPPVKANFNLEYDLPQLAGLTLDGRVVYTDEQYTDAANSNRIDAWTRLDFGLRQAVTLAGKPVTLRGRIHNVTDENYWATTGGFPGANYLVQGEPRTFILSASVEL